MEKIRRFKRGDDFWTDRRHGGGAEETFNLDMVFYRSGADCRGSQELSALHLFPGLAVTRRAGAGGHAGGPGESPPRPSAKNLLKGRLLNGQVAKKETPVSLTGEVEFSFPLRTTVSRDARGLFPADNLFCFLLSFWL